MSVRVLYSEHIYYESYERVRSRLVDSITVTCIFYSTFVCVCVCVCVCVNILLRYVNRKNVFLLIHSQELNLTLRNLNPNSAPGSDQIDNHMILHLRATWKKLLLSCINDCYSTHRRMDRKQHKINSQIKQTSPETNSSHI